MRHDCQLDNEGEKGKKKYHPVNLKIKAEVHGTEPKENLQETYNESNVIQYQGVR